MFEAITIVLAQTPVVFCILPPHYSHFLTSHLKKYIKDFILLLNVSIRNSRILHWVWKLDTCVLFPLPLSILFFKLGKNISFHCLRWCFSKTVAVVSTSSFWDLYLKSLRKILLSSFEIRYLTWMGMWGSGCLSLLLTCDWDKNNKKCIYF